MPIFIALTIGCGIGIHYWITLKKKKSKLEESREKFLQVRNQIHNIRTQ